MLLYFYVSYISLLWLKFISCLNFVPNHLQDESLQVKLPQGAVQGKLKYTTEKNLSYYSYEGIPYAKPPVGELRFKPPLEPDPWNGILDASGRVPACIQIPPNPIFWYESEDCLYINVYKPQMENPNPLAVLVWIYGGGFSFGVANSTYFGPDYLLENEVIVAHFNYRLNVFGFLSTQDMESPGNYGLKDQMFALKWVKRNIQYFGGDTNKITIFGESAGGVSVQYHVLSMKSKQLFHQAISESGSVLCPWAFQTNSRKIAFQLGLISGLVTNSSKYLMAHMRGLSVYQLKRAATHVIILNTLNIIKNGLPFAPTLEPNHPEAFISELAWNSIQKGNFEAIPQIIGFNSQESAPVQPALEMGKLFLRFWDTDPEILVPPGMNVESNKLREVGQKIKTFYFDNSKSRTLQYLNYISDSYFVRPIIESVKLFSGFAPVFMYKFSYEGDLGRQALSIGENKKIDGVMHSEEVWYLFSRYNLNQATELDGLVRRRMVKMWTNFAKNGGNPTPIKEDLLQNIEWTSIKTNTNLSYLNIDQNLTLSYNYKDKTMEFWEDLYDKYGKQPYRTY